MNCRKSLALMHEVLNGIPTDRGELEAHLEECTSCRDDFARLRRVQDLAAGAVSPAPVPEALLEAVTERVLAAVGHEGPGGRATWYAALRLALSAACAVLVFALGMAVGRQAWPREVTVTQVVDRPQVVEKRVEVTVPVPVVEERVVVRTVPVVRTRVVYRDSPAVIAAPLATPDVAPGASSSILLAFEPVVSQELQSITDVRLPAPRETEPAGAPPSGDAAAHNDSRPEMVAHVGAGGGILERGT